MTAGALLMVPTPWNKRNLLRLRAGALRPAGLQMVVVSRCAFPPSAFEIALANSDGSDSWDQTMTTELNHRIEIAASAEKIYRALTTEEGIKGWWTTDVKMDSQ